MQAAWDTIDWIVTQQSLNLKRKITVYYYSFIDFCQLELNPPTFHFALIVTLFFPIFFLKKY